MKTSNYITYLGPGRISISIGKPKFQTPPFKNFNALAPTYPMLRMPRDQYLMRFEKILSDLDPRETWLELHKMVHPHEPVLLCFCKLKSPGAWCHRTIVANWFNDSLSPKKPVIEYSETPPQEDLFDPPLVHVSWSAK